MAYRTEVHRLQLTAFQHQLLERMLAMACRLYNAALEDRRNNWEHGKRLAARRGLASPLLLPKDVWRPSNLYAQQTMLTTVRSDDPDGYGSLPANVEREALQRLDRAFDGFFRRCRSGQAPGFPRFRSVRRWKSFGWYTMNGVRIVGDALRFRAFGAERTLSFKRHRDWPAEASPCTVRLVKKVNRWEVHVQIAFAIEGEVVPVKPAFPATDVLAGLDPEIAKLLWSECRMLARRTNEAAVAADKARREAAYLAALDRNEVRGWDANVDNHATNDRGERIENPRLSVRHRQRRSRVEREVDRGRRGSKRWRRAVGRRRRLGERERNANRTFAHQVSARMVRETRFLAFEELNLKAMTASAAGTVEEPGKNVRQKSGLNREMLASCHATRARYATYKAEWAGGMVVSVPPHGTSVTCSGCGARGTMDKARVFRCGGCGLAMDRDRNAARNVLARSRGVVAPGAPARKYQGEASARAQISN